MVECSAFFRSDECYLLLQKQKQVLMHYIDSCATEPTVGRKKKMQNTKVNYEYKNRPG